MRWSRWPLHAVMIAAVVAVACGGRPPPPKRRVIEGGVDAWKFRRYQRVVDIEVWVPNNKATAHTASYVRASAEKRGRLAEGDVVNAFVTEYEREDGVMRALVKFGRRLAQEAGYVVEERKLGGQRVITVVGHGEAWAMWGSGRYVVKIGGRGLESVPAALVEAYGEPYPSRLRSGVLEGPLPAGDDEPGEPEAEPFDPDNPRPDWDGKTKRKKPRKP